MSDASWVPPTAHKRGGQLKLNPQRLARFVGVVANGLTFQAACAATGISDSSRRNWTRWGELELTRLIDQGIDPAEVFDPTEEGWPTVTTWTTVPPAIDPSQWPFVVFAVALKKAEVSFEARHLTNVQKAAEQSWQASAWILERRFPDRYSRPEVRVAVEAKAVATSSSRAEAVVSADDVEAAFLALEEKQEER